jgi:hypothetical protein
VYTIDHLSVLVSAPSVSSTTQDVRRAGHWFEDVTPLAFGRQQQSREKGFGHANIMLFLLVRSGKWIHNQAAAQKALEVLQFAYPIFLLFFFLLAFAARSVYAAPKDEDEQAPPRVQYGPGGKPLPIRSQSFRKIVPRDFSRPRKLVFEWLSVGLCLTWIGNATVVIFHAVYDREKHWWVGEAATVRKLSSIAKDSCIYMKLSWSTGLYRGHLLRLLAPPHFARRHQAIAH